MLFLMVCYIGVSYLMHAIRRIPNGSPGIFITKIFDSGSFATSLMLLWGVIDQQVLSLIGDTKSFLVTGGLAGVVYSIHALFPKIERERNRNWWEPKR